MQFHTKKEIKLKKISELSYISELPQGENIDDTLLILAGQTDNYKVSVKNFNSPIYTYIQNNINKLKEDQYHKFQDMTSYNAKTYATKEELKNNYLTAEEINKLGESFVKEAPRDSYIYARKNGKWEKIDGGAAVTIVQETGIGTGVVMSQAAVTKALSDQHKDIDTVHEELLEHILNSEGKYVTNDSLTDTLAKADAPQDSYIYGRKDGKWTRIDAEGSKVELPDFNKGLSLNTETNEVNVELAYNEIQNKNFLNLEADESGKERLAVRNIDTNKTVLQEPIKVAGLDGNIGTTYYKNDMTIDAGTDVYTILKNILSQEIFPTTTSKQGTLSVSVGQPKIDLNVSNNSLQEIGFIVKTNSPVKATKITFNKTNSKVEGFTNGYSNSDNNTAESKDTNIQTSWVDTKEIGNYSLSYETTGFTSTQLNVSDPNTDNKQVTIDGQVGIVEIGENTFTVKETSAGAKGHIDGIDSKYIVSNIGQTSEEHKSQTVPAKDYTDEIPAAAKTSTTTAKITGVYPCFTNINRETNKLDTECKFKMNLQTSNELTIENIPSEVTDKIRFKLKFPANREIKEFLIKDFNGKYVEYAGDYIIKDDDSETINNRIINYKSVITDAPFAGISSYKIILSKNLDEN